MNFHSLYQYCSKGKHVKTNVAVAMPSSLPMISFLLILTSIEQEGTHRVATLTFFLYNNISAGLYDQC
jgi:hypothetical protein